MNKFKFLRAIALIVSCLGGVLWLSGAAMAGPALLVDAETGKIFYAEDQDLPWHPASTTKLMTAFLTFEAIKNGKLKLGDAVLQSERSILEPPSKNWLPRWYWHVHRAGPAIADHQICQ